MKVRKLVIVGGVAGGASAAAKARRCSEEVEIIMYEKGPDISYANCGLPYYLSGVIEKREDLLITTSEFFRRRFQVDARTSTEVIQIDRDSKKVIVKNLNTGQIQPVNPQTEPPAASNYRVAVSFTDPKRSPG